MDREVARLANVLCQIAHDAGWVLLCREAPGTLRFSIAQYNRIHARLGEIAPALTTLFGRLPEDASAGQVRIVARALAAYLYEQTRREAMKQTRRCVPEDWFAFVWPGQCGSLTFDLC
jgi:hypothetical protein